MSACLICLDELAAAGTYHPRCVRRLFGTRRVPVIDVELAKLHTFGLAMVGRTSLSGVQRKISLGLDADRMTLQVAVARARYLLKPAGEVYPSLPENEHVTMRLAKLCRIEIPECGLIRLKDGSLAYLVARFDRPPDGGKLRCEDFCQLALRSPKEKYDGSAELCARLVRRHASEPLVQQRELFRLVLFGWWTGNGDMHLKNFSLLADLDGRQRLSPAYDLLCTRLVIPDDPLALPVGGKRDGITRRTWREYADYCELPRATADRELAAMARAVEPAQRLVARSLLPDEMKADYLALLEQRGRALVPA
jgi:serine/threonine-protein kinase HipA